MTAHCGVHVLELNRQGLIEPAGDGYYFHQTRFLSRFALTSAGKAAKPVSCANIEPHATIAYYLLPTPAGRPAAPPGDDDPSGGEIVAKGIEIQIGAFVGGGLHQDIFVTNHGLVRTDLTLDLDFAADFADRQEVEVRRASSERRGGSPLRLVLAGPGRTDADLCAPASSACRPDHGRGCGRRRRPGRRRSGVPEPRPAGERDDLGRCRSGVSRRAVCALVRTGRGADSELHRRLAATQVALGRMRIRSRRPARASRLVEGGDRSLFPATARGRRRRDLHACRRRAEIFGPFRT